MKKLLALLLVLAMCLGLSACATEDEKAFEAANALLESGDYEGAMEAYRAIPFYQEVAAKIEEANNLYNAENIGFLVGTWKNLKGDTVAVVAEDGSYVVTTSGSTYDGTVHYEDGIVNLWGEHKVEEIDGVLHLVSEYYDMVPEANYDDLCAKPIAITMDNWDTYFDLKEGKRVSTNGFGEIENVYYGYAVVLKEEYAQKLFNPYNAIDVTFKLEYEEEHRYINGDYPDGGYTVGGSFTQRWYTYETKESTSDVYQVTYEGYAQSDFFGKYIADFENGYVSTWDKQPTVCMPVNGRVIAVTGTIQLFP